MVSIHHIRTFVGDDEVEAHLAGSSVNDLAVHLLRASDGSPYSLLHMTQSQLFDIENELRADYKESLLP